MAISEKQWARARALKTSKQVACELLSDAEASLAIGLYPVLREGGQLVKADTRINWHGSLKRAAVDLWDRPENSPANAPALWEDVLYRAGHRIIPEVITVGLAFSKGEKGWWNDVLYESLRDDNVWTPDALPTAWEMYEGE